MYSINKPEVPISSFSKQVFDENGQLMETIAVQLIGQLLENLVSFARKISQDNTVIFNMN